MALWIPTPGDLFTHLGLLCRIDEYNATTDTLWADRWSPSAPVGWRFYSSMLCPSTRGDVEGHRWYAAAFARRGEARLPVTPGGWTT